MLQASLVHQRKVKKPPLDMEIRGQRLIHLHPTDPQVGTAPAWVLSWELQAFRLGTQLLPVPPQGSQPTCGTA